MRPAHAATNLQQINSIWIVDLTHRLVSRMVSVNKLNWH
uniref:Uncharacterized protein n=1 Tax=Arundo donax TaxID=35708 RepID=A0A0A9BWG0_ARUDO